MVDFLVYENMSDEELCDLSKNNSVATEILINRYYNIVEIISRGFFISGSESDDVLQEGLIGLSSAIESFKEGSTMFKTFASLCIERQILTAIKSANRNKHLVLSKALSYNNLMSNSEDEVEYIEYIDIGSNINNPEQVLVSKETVKNIKSVINEILTSFEKEVLQLYLKGESYENIGKCFSKDSKSIDNAIQRIRRKLKIELNRWEE
ncbi:MAG: sigma-70 family RNA polymerase sigma factor [Lachnospirales bacterium]